MKNVLLRVCRATHRYNERQIAAKMGMTPEEYIDLETGVTIMTPRQAEQLSDVYNIEREYFLESSEQLDLLLARAEVIRHLQSEVERLKQFAIVTKDLLPDGGAKNEVEETD
jgi:transcriptional regulator with XRE-family HTH domain